MPPPVPPPLTAAGAAAPALPDAATPRSRPVDKTKDLLVPVTDLLTLQTEMQSALARLSSTLEHFVSDMVASEEKTSAITGRLQQLEDELESTRERLRETEALLPDSAYHAVAAIAAATAATDTTSSAPRWTTARRRRPGRCRRRRPRPTRSRQRSRRAAAAPVVPPAFGAAPAAAASLPGCPAWPCPPCPAAHRSSSLRPVAAAPPAFGPRRQPAAAPPPLPPMSAATSAGRHAPAAKPFSLARRQATGRPG